MIDDRVSFAKKASAAGGFGLANEICIIKYFNELMAMYNLIEGDESTLMSNKIENYWFDNENQKFNMVLEFKNSIYLNKFYNDIMEGYGGFITIYGMMYKVYCDLNIKKSLCKIYLEICTEQQSPI